MLKHSIFEGIKNLVRSFWLSITAIFIIFVSLTSVALVASLWVGAGFTLRQFDRQALIYVDLKDGVSSEARDSMQSDLRSLQQVNQISFIDKEQAQERLKSNAIAARSFDSIQRAGERTRNSVDFLKESFEIVPNRAEDYITIEEFLKQDKYLAIVDNVQGTQEYIEQLQRIYYWTGIIGAVLVIIFSLISILVMVNILRIAIYSRREELEIMRLVGATNSYIRGPFIAEGILYNFLASIFVFLIFIPLFLYLAPSLRDILGLGIDTESTALINNLYIALTITNVMGLAIGGFAAMLATQRYLKL